MLIGRRTYIYFGCNCLRLYSSGSTIEGSYVPHSRDSGQSFGRIRHIPLPSTNALVSRIRVTNLGTFAICPASAGLPFDGAREPKSIIRQNVNLAKLPLNLLYTLGAARVGIAVPPARYGRPTIFIWHDRNGNWRCAFVK
jgi:hypothetical protein